MRRWKAWIGIFLLFGLGFLCGVLLSHWHLHRDFMLRPDRALTYMEQSLVDRLQLTSDQKAVLRDSVKQAQLELRDLINRAKPEVEVIIIRAQQKLEPMLSEEQKGMLEEWRRDARRFQQEMEEAERRRYE